MDFLLVSEIVRSEYTLPYVIIPVLHGLEVVTVLEEAVPVRNLSLYYQVHHFTALESFKLLRAQISSTKPALNLHDFIF